MNGYDDIDLTLQHEDEIAAYEKMRAEKFPFKPKTCLLYTSRCV